MADAVAVPVAAPVTPAVTPPAAGAKPGAKPAATAPAAASSPAPELFELVIDGKTEKLTRDQLILRAQKAAAADKRFTEASKRTKDVNSFLEQLKHDPEAALEQLGIDLDGISETRLAKKARLGLMTEQERKSFDMEQRLAKYEAQEKQTKAQQEAAHRQRLDQENGQKLELDLVAAAQRHGLIQNDSGDPAHLEMMSLIALDAIDGGYEMTPDQVAQETKYRLEQISADRDRKIAGGLQGNRLLSYLGPKTVQAVLEASLAKMNSTAPAPAEPEPEPVSAPDKKPYLTEADFDQRMAKKLGTRR